MLEIGKYNKLTVLRKVDFGYYLDGLDYGDILMPAKYAEESLEPGDDVDVFVYLDSSEKLIATTEKPLAEVGQIGYLKVVKVNDIGAFLDWGVTKQLFVPFAEQKSKLEEDKFYWVYIFIDPVTERIMGSTKLGKFLDQTPPFFKANEITSGLVWQKTDLGYKIIINHSHTGLLFNSEIYKTLQPGDLIDVEIKNVRPDGKIDLCLPKSALEKSDEVSEIVLKKLQANNGFLPFGDHTAPEIIKQELGLSKKSFKKAIGKLYKERTITIEENGIYLIVEE